MSASGHVKSAERVLDVLELLAGARRPTPTMFVARECRMPKSSTHRLLNMLRDRGWVIYDAGSRGWTLSPAAHIVTDGPRQHLGRVAGPVLEELARTTGLITQLAVRDGEDVLFVARRCPGGRIPQLRSTPGVPVPAVRTAAGRALIMHLSAAELREMRGGSAVIPDLAAARARGVAEFVGGLTAGVRCLAAPVAGRDGAPIAALTISMSADATVPELDLVLRRAAARVAAALASPSSHTVTAAA